MPETNNKKLNDLENRLSNLWGQLSENSLNKQVIIYLNQICELIKTSDTKTANQIHMKMSNIDWENNKVWTVAIKRLISGR